MDFPPLKSGDRITRAWFNKLIAYMNSLSLSGDGITTRVSHGSAGTVVSAVPQIAEAAGGAFRNFFMSPDAAGTGIVIGEGYYYLESAGVRNLQRQSSVSVTSANMPPADGNIYYYCLGMRGAPPWIGGFGGSVPSWSGTLGAAPAGLSPVVIGAVKMTTPVQVFQPPALGIPVIPALPSSPFSVYATYGGSVTYANAYHSFAAIPPYKIHVNGGYAAGVTNYHGENAYPPKDFWLYSGAWAEFDAADFASGRTMIAAKLGSTAAATVNIVTLTTFRSHTFTSPVWDYDAAKAIVPLARIDYYPNSSPASLSIMQVHPAIYAVPLYDPHN